MATRRTRSKVQQLAEEGIAVTPPQQLADPVRRRRTRQTRSESSEPDTTAPSIRPETSLTRTSGREKKGAGAPKRKPGRKAKTPIAEVTTDTDDPHEVVESENPKVPHSPLQDPLGSPGAPVASPSPSQTSLLFQKIVEVGAFKTARHKAPSEDEVVPTNPSKSLRLTLGDLFGFNVPARMAPGILEYIAGHELMNKDLSLGPTEHQFNIDECQRALHKHGLTSTQLALADQASPKRSQPVPPSSGSPAEPQTPSHILANGRATPTESMGTTQPKPWGSPGSDKQGHMSQTPKTIQLVKKTTTQEQPEHTHVIYDLYCQKQAQKLRETEARKKRRLLYSDDDSSSSSDDDIQMEDQAGPSGPVNLAGIQEDQDTEITEEDASMEEAHHEQPEAPQTPIKRGWGLSSLLPTAARSVSRFIPGLGRRNLLTPQQTQTQQQHPAATVPRQRPHVSATQTRETRANPNLRETSGNAKLLTKEAASKRKEEKRRRKEMKEDTEKKQMREEISRLQGANDEAWRKGRDFGLSNKVTVTNPLGMRRGLERAGIQITHEQAAEERRRAVELQARLTARRPTTQPKKSKRKRSPSPDVIPNPPGCSYGMDERYFFVDSSSEDDESNGPPSSKRSRTSGDFTADFSTSPRMSLPGDTPRQEVVGNPFQATPYTGTRFKLSDGQEKETIESERRLIGREPSSEEDATEEQTPRPTYNSFRVPSPTSSDDMTFEDESHHEPATPTPSTHSEAPETSVSSSRLARKESTTPMSSPPKQQVAPAATVPIDITSILEPFLPKPPPAPSATEISLQRQREQALKYTAKTPSRLQQSSRLSTTPAASEASPTPTAPVSTATTSAEPLPTATAPAEPLPTAPTPAEPFVPTEYDFESFYGHQETCTQSVIAHSERFFDIEKTVPFAHKQFDREFADFVAWEEMQEAGFGHENPPVSDRVKAYLDKQMNDKVIAKAGETFGAEFEQFLAAQ